MLADSFIRRRIELKRISQYLNYELHGPSFVINLEKMDVLCRIYGTLKNIFCQTLYFKVLIKNMKISSFLSFFPSQRQTNATVTPAGMADDVLTSLMGTNADVSPGSPDPTAKEVGSARFR